MAVHIQDVRMNKNHLRTSDTDVLDAKESLQASGTFSSNRTTRSIRSWVICSSAHCFPQNTTDPLSCRVCINLIGHPPLECSRLHHYNSYPVKYISVSEEINCRRFHIRCERERPSAGPSTNHRSSISRKYVQRRTTNLDHHRTKDASRLTRYT